MIGVSARRFGLFLSTCLSLFACAPPTPPPNLVLIVLDTVRADHLGIEGYRRDTSPTMDALAGEGAYFSSAHSVASYTRPSTASMLTGVYPATHGAITHSDSIVDDTPALAKELAALGYRTAGIVRNGNVAGRFGFDRGFEQYHQPDGRFIRERQEDGDPVEFVSETDDSLLTADAVDFLEAGAGTDRPFFLYLHLGGAHYPYAPPPSAPVFHEPLSATLSSIYTERLKPLRDEPLLLQRLRRGEVTLTERERQDFVALYDGEIAFADRQIEALMQALRRLSLAEQTVVVITSDHGEEFWDHGDLGHGQSHYEELLHVPLLFHGRGIRPQSLDTPVSLIDLAPTLLDLAGGEPATAGFVGRTLAATLRSGRALEARPLYAEGLLNFSRSGEPLFFRSLQIEQEKLVLDFRWHRKELFDLRADPAETSNRFGNDEPSRRLWTTLREQHQSASADLAAPGTDVEELPEDLERQLRAMGYVGSVADSEPAADLFRRPLRVTDFQPSGFLGHELHAGSYASELELRPEDPQLDPVTREQLLFGWRLLDSGSAVRFARHSAARLARPDGATRWQFAGRLVDADPNRATDQIAISIDGGEERIFEVDPRGRFSITDELPRPSGRLQGFTRIDVRCLAGGSGPAATSAAAERACGVASRLRLF